MTIQYFADTDTALIDFSDKDIAETREISENLYLDIDEHGNIVSMTIERAKESGALEELVYREIGKRST
jgi:uncharacterized protein YuzE